ncbi:MAG: beta-propeller fold lactonase family protein, partial [Gemmiger qucibialis]
GGACATADGTLFVSNRGPNTISAWQRSGPTRHFLCEWPTGDWPRALCAVPGTLYLLAACQREGAVHCYYCSPLPHRAPTETASLALPGASCALVLD